jgi:hypothetical protein
MGEITRYLVERIPSDLASPEWSGIAVHVSGIYTVATIALVCVAVLQFIVFWRLQWGLNKFTKESESRQKKESHITLQRERLLELSRDWNSSEFLKARIRADMFFDRHGEEARISYDLDNLDDWLAISLILHFFERLGLLLESEQILGEEAKSEFKNVAFYWYTRLIAVYDANGVERNTHQRIVRCLICLGCTEQDIDPFNIAAFKR